MGKLNIIKWLYRISPMNFYNLSENSTVIKSINNTLLGYKFDKKFDSKEISSVWENIKIHKRLSVIGIFLVFIILLYAIIFPNYSLLITYKWYYTIIPLLLVLFFAYKGIIYLNTIWFEKRLLKKFGTYEKILFKQTNIIDKKYFNLFKLEIAKVLTLILIIIGCFSLGSPFKALQNQIKQERYDDVIKYTTIGIKIFPIAYEWYSLRGYAKFKIKDYEGAIKDFDKAYQIGLDEYNILNFDNKIYVKYYIKDYEGAIKDFDYEIANCSDEYEKDAFLWDKAQFLYNLGKYDEALQIYNDLLVKSEEDRIFLLKNRLYFERAQVYKKMGKTKPADEDILNAENLNIEESFKNPIPAPSLILDEDN